MTTTIELVRHAKALARDRWWGRPDRDRPLTDSGIEQSKVLARELPVGEPITAIYSSPLVRCTATVAPLAEALDLEILHEDSLAEAVTLPVLDAGGAWVASAWLAGRALAFVNRVTDERPDERIVVCSHGDVIPALLAALVGRDGIDLEEVRVRKGARVALAFDGRRCVGADPVDVPD